MKISKAVMCETLAPLFLLDKSLEEVPEPFRMQGNVIFTVDFSEYLRFIELCLEKDDYLSQPTSTLKTYLNMRDEKSLYSAFLCDMAHAVAKELHYAESSNKDATTIIHTRAGVATKTIPDVIEMYRGVRTFTEDKLRTHMYYNNFQLPKFFREKNNILWEYANVLYFFSMAPGTPWMLNKEDFS